MAADPVTGKVVVYGGSGFRSSTDVLDDTWTWNGTAWKPIPGAPRPPARTGAAMAADPASGTVVLFGGSSPVAGQNVFVDRDDTWTWDGTTKTWTEEIPPIRPTPRDGASMAYDAATNTVVLFGGGNETWTWAGTTKTWTRQEPPISPPDRSWAAMAYDAVSRKVVLFGGQPCHGCVGIGDTWTWDGATKTWAQQDPPASPKGRNAAYMAYHATTARVVLFGGVFNGSGLNDTWTWDGATSTWTKQQPTNRPCPRFGGGMAYHAASNTAVIFGGSRRNCPSGDADTWGWTGKNWKSLA